VTRDDLHRLIDELPEHGEGIPLEQLMAELDAAD
jgi:hypothetical protein